MREERTNAPTPAQFRVGRNPNYLDSLIAGVVSPIVHLPQILWFGSFWPFLKSLWRGLSFIIYSMVAGIAGQANGFRTVEVSERPLTEEEKQKALDDMLLGSGFIAVSLKKIGGNRVAETSQETSEDRV